MKGILAGSTMGARRPLGRRWRRILAIPFLAAPALAATPAAHAAAFPGALPAGVTLPAGLTLPALGGPNAHPTCFTTPGGVKLCVTLPMPLSPTSAGAVAARR